MHIILVQWSIKEDRIGEFLNYWKQPPRSEHLLFECMSRVEEQGQGFRWRLDTAEGITFVNVAIWRSKQDFVAAFDPQDEVERKGFEATERVRASFEVVGTHLGELPFNEFIHSLVQLEPGNT